VKDANAAPQTRAWTPRVVDPLGLTAVEADGSERAPFLSVVVPAYNERDVIAETIAEIESHLRTAGIDHEVIVVCDGATDGTGAVVEELARENPRLRVLNYRKNRGKGYAVRSGVALARGEYVMFIDADLAIPVSIADDFLDALGSGYDIAIASRRLPESTALVAPPRLRRVMGDTFSWFVRRLIVSDVRDTQCGAKAYRGDAARKLFATQQIDHFSFDAEVIFLAERAGYRIKEVPFALLHAPSGSSIRPVRDSLLMLRDLVRIRWNALRGRYD
jgi:dolichyl-phosphate beta-glucosyltransferase